MAQLSRRGFLEKTSLGVAAAGALLAMPGLTDVPDALAAPEASKHLVSGPLVAHVRNMKTGEVAVMVGTRQVIIHDRRLVARLVKAAS